MSLGNTVLQLFCCFFIIIIIIIIITIVPLTQFGSVDQIEKNEMGRACNT